MLSADFLIDRRDGGVELSFCVPPGRRLGIFGPSGAGKTTALDVVAGLAIPRYGHVSLAGRPLTNVAKGRTIFVPPNERQIGLIGQRPTLFPHLSVRENLLYGKGIKSFDLLVPMIERLELMDLLTSQPRQLSGGEVQRVSIARTLARENQALLLDEPFQGLDDRLRAELILLLDELLSSLQIPVVIVAHELELVSHFADDIIVVENGRALGFGEVPTLLKEPPSVRLASILGFTHFVPIDSLRRIGIHPARMLAGAEPTRGYVFPVSILSTRDVGGAVLYRLQLADQQLVVSFADDRLSHGGDPKVTVLDPPVFGKDDECQGSWLGMASTVEGEVDEGR
ncbi:ATP-binding cassette domain-containing protein [Ferrimicrobium acidiphilum]|uniref:Sulfate/thiosulfate import ATP-binding protein CysA n=1 Tax=Ferrimicrobium acidiphilum DSM 19497 TaxID=1121877 RepID=A0A0D8FQU2_9ACTN|nr:ATP-binding cassette domain-containing protein [Ferrimicrobium acidiphilum]KJE75319.1 sulfate/thiosulfate import ATP-binding protein CysA [Ferrimicrobium acidiphilum DSM 19497]